MCENYFAFSASIRRAIYTSKDHFPHDDAVKKIIYLTLRSVAAHWKQPPQCRPRVKAEFAIRFEERFKLKTK